MLLKLGTLALLTSAGTAFGADDKSPKNQSPANRLAKETSPYLLLHAHNPVDWYPWGPEAFARAKAENKPVFLSVGYSSCYWCHVMERESFVDPAIAKALNASFVCIKVDREERPDIDQVYMAALQAFRPGGWPMSLFLTPDGRPFFAGSYFPPRDRDGSAGFLTIVGAVAKAWTEQRADLDKTANQVTEIVRKRLKSASGPRKLTLSDDAETAGIKQLADQFDAEYGGFGFNPANSRRPKFPQPVDLTFLLEESRNGVKTASPTDPLKMVVMTIDHMARGGIRDHLGGGYHRYSTDRFWLVPHFEKMLYDNAQLASLHLAAFEITHDPRWQAEAEATFAFIAQRMTAPEGGFFSALDAETRAEEGAYYVWKRDEVKSVLGSGPDTDLFCEVYGLQGDPNFEGGRYVLHEPRSLAEVAKRASTTPEAVEARLRPLRERLLAARDKRLTPMCDDKILTGWNGLMIAAYADGYRVLKNTNYRAAAEKAADFLLTRLRAPDGRLLRTFRQGEAKLGAYQEDYAFLAHGLIKLHAATNNQRWLDEARKLVDRMIADFEDHAEGGFFFTADGHETLLARAKDPFDNALPSGNGIAILDLMALYRLTGEESYRKHARSTLDAFSSSISQVPAAVPMTLLGLHQYLRSVSDRVLTRPLATGTHEDKSDQIVNMKLRLAETTPAKLEPGAEFDAVLSVTIADGWHIYGNPALLAEMKPTTLKLDDRSQTWVRLVKVSYPPGEIKALGSSGDERASLYEHKVDFKVRLQVNKNAEPGEGKVILKLSYQACNDQVCQAPATREVSLAITIGR